MLEYEFWRWSNESALKIKGSCSSLIDWRFIDVLRLSTWFSILIEFESSWSLCQLSWYYLCEGYMCFGMIKGGYGSSSFILRSGLFLGFLKSRGRLLFEYYLRDLVLSWTRSWLRFSWSLMFMLSVCVRLRCSSEEVMPRCGMVVEREVSFLIFLVLSVLLPAS